MTIQQVLLSNTFNEFRTTFNDAANVINGLQDGTESANVVGFTAQTVTVDTANATTANVATLEALTGQFNDETDANTLGTGSVTLAGGLSVQKKLQVGANATFHNSVIIEQDLFVNGNTVHLNVTNFEVEDTFIYLNANNTITNPDFGITGNYNDGTFRHGGVFRDASDDGRWKFFKDYVPEADHPVDTEDATFKLADLLVNNFTANNTYSNTVNLLTDDGTKQILVQAPATLAANLSVTLPNANPAANGDCLVADTDGTYRYEARATTGKAIAMAIVFGG
jgi:hypothetical protein